MDAGNEESNLFCEHRSEQPSSPFHDNVSDDEDQEHSFHELEAMLYSQIHHEKVASPDSQQPQHIPVRQDNIGKECGDVLTITPLVSVISESFKIKPNCRRSEFNKVGRTKASRYYDEHQNKQDPKPPFVTPIIPSKGLSRSPVQETMYSKNSKASNTMLSVLQGRFSPYSKENAVKKHSENSFSVQQKNTSKATESKSLSSAAKTISVAITEVVKSSDKSNTGNQCVSKKQLTEVKIVETEEAPKEVSSPIQDCLKDKIESNASDNQQNEKQVAKKHQEYDDQISQVVSSMLDDGSSSVDDNLVLTKASQASKSSFHESGWSVGMSWFDMSSSHFEVESVDSESLCSFPAQDNSIVSETGANIPDARPIEKDATNVSNSASPEEGNNEEDSLEPSRYQLRLKIQSDQQSLLCKESDVLKDTDSEEDSVIEMQTPVKPLPALVDLSDGEFDAEPGVSSENIKLKDSVDEDDIIFLCSQKKLKSPRIEEIVVSDDDVVLVHKKVPGLNTTNVSNINITEKKSLKAQTLEAGADKLSPWLKNPIEASRHLDHQRLLDKMSDAPGLWRLCAQDLSWGRYSPRGPKCINCNQFGHKSRLCPDPPKSVLCHMCGTAGHRESRCPKKMCLKCGKPNNVFTERCKGCSIRTMKCKICHSDEHGWKTCPDMWRRYHMTTAPGQIIQLNENQQCPPSLQWCCNCARKGHLSHECRSVQWKCEFISPFVESYRTPAEEEHRILNGPTTATILLTEEDAKLLKAQEGVQFLSGLSSTRSVSVHLNTDSVLKKIMITGSSIDQEETRLELKKWLNPKRKISTLQSRKKMTQISVSLSGSSGSRKANGPRAEVATIDNFQQDVPIATSNSLQREGQHSEQITSVSSSQHNKPSASSLLEKSTDKIPIVMTFSDDHFTPNGKKKNPAPQATHNQQEGGNKLQDNACNIKNSNNLCHPASQNLGVSPPIPKGRVKLMKFIEGTLQFIKNQKSEDVERIYSQILKLAQSTPHSRTQGFKLKALHRKLNFALLGKFKVGPGREHINALHNILNILKQLKGTSPVVKNLSTETAEHYVPLFMAYPRSDLAELMQEYHEKHKRNGNSSDKKKVQHSSSQSEQPQQS